MTRKRFSEEDILGILRQIELDLAGGGDSTSKWYIKRGLYRLPNRSRPLLLQT